MHLLSLGIYHLLLVLCALVVISVWLIHVWSRHRHTIPFGSGTVMKLLNHSAVLLTSSGTSVMYFCSVPKNMLVSPKNKDPMEHKYVIIYWYRCQELDCDDEYIGHSARTFDERFKHMSKHLHPYITSIPALATPQPWNTSTLWTGRGRPFSEQSVSPYF